jgi:hypothetical protein
MSLEEKTVDLLDKLELLVTNYSPEVFDTAVAIVKIDAISALSVSTIILIICILAVKGIIVLRVFCDKKYKEADSAMSDWDLVRDISTLVLAFIVLLTVISCLSSILHVWNWIALFNPELALAHNLFEKIGG